MCVVQCMCCVCAVCCVCVCGLYVIIQELEVNIRDLSQLLHQDFSFSFKDYFSNFMSVLPVCLQVHPVHTVPGEAGRGSRIPWNWSFRLLRTSADARN